MFLIEPDTLYMAEIAGCLHKFRRRHVADRHDGDGLILLESVFNKAGHEWIRGVRAVWWGWMVDLVEPGSIKSRSCLFQGVIKQW